MTFKECFELGVDFMPLPAGIIYKIQDYKNAKNLGLPAILYVTDTEGTILGVVDEDDLKNALK